MILGFYIHQIGDIDFGFVFQTLNTLRLNHPVP